MSTNKDKILKPRAQIIKDHGMYVMDKFIKHSYDWGSRSIHAILKNYEDTFFLENIIYNELIVRGFDVYTGKTYNGEVDFAAIKDLKKCFIRLSYYMINDKIIEREFGAFSPIKDASPKIVLSLDRIDLSRNGIIHINIVDFLLGIVDLLMT